MCEPVFMIASAGLASAGAIMSGQAKQQAYEARALVEERKAEAERVASGYQTRRAQERAGALAATQRNTFAARGLAFAGSAQDVVADSAREASLDMSSNEWSSGVRQQNFRTQANLDRMAGQTAMNAGVFQAVEPWMKLGRSRDFRTALNLNPFGGPA